MLYYATDYPSLIAGTFWAATQPNIATPPRYAGYLRGKFVRMFDRLPDDVAQYHGPHIDFLARALTQDRRQVSSPPPPADPPLSPSAQV